MLQSIQIRRKQTTIIVVDVYNDKNNCMIRFDWLFRITGNVRYSCRIASFSHVSRIKLTPEIIYVRSFVRESDAYKIRRI